MSSIMILPQLLLFGLLLGAPNDALDYISADVYWKAKAVPITIDQMTTELAPAKTADISALIDKLDSEIPAEREKSSQQIAAVGPAALPQLQAAADGPGGETSRRCKALIAQIRLTTKSAGIRQLMAIRTLGELKDAKGLPVLQPLLQSKEPFVAEYAAAAIAVIGGKPATRAAMTAAQRDQDIALLPATLDLVAQLISGPKPSFSLDQVLALASESGSPAEVRQQINDKLLPFLEQIGNVRIDGLTVGIWANGPNHSEYTVFELHGLYDCQAAAAALRQMGITPQTVNDTEVFHFQHMAWLILASDQRALYILDRQIDAPPAVVAMTTALKAGTGDFQNNKELSAVIKSIDTAQSSAWAAARLTGVMKTDGGPFAAFDDLTVTVSRSDKTLSGMLTGSTPDTATAAADQLRTQIADGTSALQRQAARAAESNQPPELRGQPSPQPIIDFLQAVKVTINGAKVTAAGSLDISETCKFVIRQQTYQMNARRKFEARMKEQQEMQQQKRQQQMQQRGMPQPALPATEP